ncbi:hypothetical protein B0H10DRAFT_2391792 [Mycena sp. CBHHK59/15]|nr:hypothetical protein B0H10DRAFT_2391792 [Mycena sp. CBHHK59/15]
MKFTTFIPFICAGLGLVRAVDDRLLYTIPAGDTMDEFTAATCGSWQPAIDEGLTFVESLVEPGDFSGHNAAIGWPSTAKPTGVTHGQFLIYVEVDQTDIRGVGTGSVSSESGSIEAAALSLDSTRFVSCALVHPLCLSYWLGSLNDLEKTDMIFVVGAGVVGLSTAVRALEAGYNVTIFAELFPGDKKSIKYTSCWAGANHISVLKTTPLLHQLERDTMHVLFDLIKADPLVPVMIRPQMEYIATATELPDGAVYGATFSTICIDVPRYLPYLWDRFLAAGGHAFRVTLPSLSALLSEKDRPALTHFHFLQPTYLRHSILQLSSTAQALVHCLSEMCSVLFSFFRKLDRSTDSLPDTDVYPTRGEVLIIRAPWIHHGMTYLYKNTHVSYVIPRQSGDAILGGTFQVDDWHPTSRPETVKLIKERGIKLTPSFTPRQA